MTRVPAGPPVRHLGVCMATTSTTGAAGLGEGEDGTADEGAAFGDRLFAVEGWKRDFAGVTGRKEEAGVTERDGDSTGVATGGADRRADERVGDHL